MVWSCAVGIRKGLVLTVNKPLSPYYTLNTPYASVGLLLLCKVVDVHRGPDPDQSYNKGWASHAILRRRNKYVAHA